ncbi:S8 family serine peptidase [Streptomyces tricolor]|nr:S8 family serine peptidase [Streptomyces tricolor]
MGAASCYDDDLLDSLSKIVDNHLADIVSNSWGDVEANQTPDLAAAYDQVFQLGAVRGHRLLLLLRRRRRPGRGVRGQAGRHPGQLAWVTAVGGTSLAVGKDGSTCGRPAGAPWKAPLSADGKSWEGFPGTFTSGAGGGTSRTVPQPYYQKGVVPKSLATANSAAGNRVVPDIAAIADPNTGFLVGQTQTFPDGSQRYSEYRIGGTSLAAPVIAAVQAWPRRPGAASRSASPTR